MRGLFLRLTGIPLIYDAVQEVVGSRAAFRRLSRLVPPGASGLVLDIGAGTGRAADVVPAGAHYVALDLDRARLLTARGPGARSARVVADAAVLPVQSGTAAVVLCCFLSHHLTDDQLRSMIGELARVSAGPVLFMDAVASPARLVSRVLWHYDEGRFPRRKDVLLEELRRHFTLETVEEFAILHRYVLCRCLRRRPAAS